MTNQERQSESVSETQSTSKWLSKHPVPHFYGPEDYYEGMVVVAEISRIEAEIVQWYVDYHKLSLWNKIRHLFSSEGIHYDG